MLTIFATSAVAVMAALHVSILILEMFFWTTARAERMFGIGHDFALATRAMAANQGLYNGFLAAGLLWGLASGAGGLGVEIFFLACIIVAGIFGACTASRKILLIQAIPGAVSLALVLATR
jgi:putative membrane protein